MLYREPMWLKYSGIGPHAVDLDVSVLYREPMWLKSPEDEEEEEEAEEFQCSTVSRCG